MLERLLECHDSERQEIGNQVITIAVEGSVCAGKSTLLKRIACLNPEAIVNEYMVYPPIPNKPLRNFPPQDSQEAKENFLYFLEVEKLRKEDHALSQTSAKYLDRSIFTLLAFELGMYFVSGIDIFGWGLSQVTSSKDIIIPDKIVYLDVSKQVALERARGANMKVPMFLFSDEFNSGFRSLFVTLNKIKPGYVTFINADQSEDSVYEQYRAVSDNWKANP